MIHTFIMTCSCTVFTTQLNIYFKIPVSKVHILLQSEQRPAYRTDGEHNKTVVSRKNNDFVLKINQAKTSPQLGCKLYAGPMQK